MMFEVQASFADPSTPNIDTLNHIYTRQSVHVVAEAGLA